MSKTNYLSVILVFLLLTGCASYRTNSNLEFESTNVGDMDPDFIILEGDLVDIPYTAVGPVEAVVSKLTAFHKDPTKEQVDVVLFQKAALMGANAVINVEYKEGVGLWTWGYMQANGIAVKTETDPSEELTEGEGNQANIQFMGMAAEEIASKTYDKILWVKALTLAEGDKEKQKGIYINLRSSQLASLNKNLTEQTTPNIEAASKCNVSGTYISEITESGIRNNFEKKHRNMKITFYQYGNTITGADSSRTFKINGTCEGNLIIFYIVRGNTINGVWKVNADASRLEGKWNTDGGGGSSGKWNLTKVE